MGHRDTVADMSRLRLPVAWDEAAPAAAAQVPTGDDGAPARPLWKRFGWLGALALAGAGAAAWQFAGGEPPARFTTAVAEIATIEDIVSATGTVQPLEYVDVGTQVTGQLRTLRVAVGDVVKKGDLVAEIDPTVFESKVATGRAQLQNLHAQLREREAQAQLADLLRDRNRKLRAADAVSEELTQQTDAAAVQARAQVDAVRAQIQQALSSLSGDEANLRYTRIYAPMSGTIVSLNARQGQTLVSNQQAPVILRIADLSTMTVWAQVSEADVPRVNVGMPVYFNTLGLPDRRWKGQVRQVMPTPETVNNVVLYNVLFDVTNPDGALKPQMSTQVFFRVASAENAVAIPVAALQTAVKPLKERPRGKQDRQDGQETAAAKEPRPDKAYLVRVVNDGGQVEERTVTVGLQTRLQAQVTSGLVVGEEVVVDNAAARAKAGKAKKAAD
ncbi:macrolide transporter subunit MacA [Ramlibacter monticola]